MIGDMRYRVTIQRAAVTRGELGAQVDGWSTGREVWAGVTYRAAGSDERTAGKQVVSRNRVDVTLRRESGPITATDRVIFQGEVLQVDSVLRTGERMEYLLLECQQVGGEKLPS